MSAEQLEDEVLIGHEEARADTPRAESPSISAGVGAGDATSDDAPQRKPKSPELIAALAAADAAAAATDTPAADSPSGETKNSLLDEQSVQLPHLPSPFDDAYPQSRGGDRWTKISPDAHCMMCELEKGEGPNAPVLNRVYVNVVGKLQDGTVFYDYPLEELDFTLGQAQVPKGLEMAVCQMNAGQQCLIRCCSDYGFSSTRRPPTVPIDAPLFFLVRVLRWEKEKNLHEMSLADKFAYCDARRSCGKDLFASHKPLSAARQYDKAITALESVRNHEVDMKTVQQKNELITLFLVNQAQCYMKVKDYSGVLDRTSKALVLSPQHMKALYRRAEAHKAREEWTDALRHYERVEALYRPSPSASDAEKAELAERARADGPILASIRASVREVQRRSEAHAVAQRKRMGGFMSASTGGLYDDLPMVSPTAPKPPTQTQPEDDYEWLNHKPDTGGLWDVVTGTFKATVAFFRSWCRAKQRETPVEGKKKQ